MKHLTLAAAMVAGLAGAAHAEDIVLIIGNEDYRGIPDVRRGDDVTGARRRFADTGVELVVARDATKAELRQAHLSLDQMAADADRMLVVLSGRFVRSATETYFLPTDIGAPSLADVSSDALPLSVVLAYLAASPGNSFLALATDNTEGSYGAFLNVGIGALDLPQGVTLLRADPQRMARFVSRTLTQPGEVIGEAAASAGIAISGFAPEGQIFLPKPAPKVVEPAPEPSNSADNRLQDLLAWREADRVDTPDAYQTYIDTFPNGQFVGMAENRIKAATDTPELRAERDEQALDLNREQRREIQRDLSLLDFNTRGIDGIFGRGTRAAISAWQKVNGFDETGFLSRDQITRLDAQAERRAAELEAEAEQRREEQLAADRAFWAETGEIGDEAGYRVYLERFPDGEFSDLARARLDAIERNKRADTSSVDRQLWDEARAANSVRAYRDYLDLAPNGAFREEAAERLAALEKAEAEASQTSAAARQEQAMNLNTSTRRVIESRLDRLGLKPGRVDGTFDDNTRRAIRRYQQARNLPVTGYLNEKVVVQLLSDSVRSIFR